ncbi:hypothetical protein NC653_034544 [Populus alba x Populus x berolinensis]|uniref:Uncharacterized protein n=1 Tax=Populus alba x Populus x berolinensis TaxID=444605 RepID=A0AAD6LMS7_9ROSI|nr:hypothetical protein NC653_034544 [Populus alba x Populus x berolinensis]
MRFARSRSGERDSRSCAAVVRSTPSPVPDKTADVMGAGPGPKHKETCVVGVNLCPIVATNDEHKKPVVVHETIEEETEWL